MTVLVVGAGISGVACARRLLDGGVDVQVVERGRVPGGRMASRRLGEPARYTDLGAAYFTVSDDAFHGVVDGWASAGLAREWTSSLAIHEDGAWGRTSDGPVRWAAPRGLRSLVAELAAPLTIEYGRAVESADTGAYEAVVLAMPDPQALRLVPAGHPAVDVLAGREWAPVISVAAGFAVKTWDELPAAFVNDSDVVDLVADDGSRRGDGAPVLVAHSTAAVAEQHDQDPDGAVAPVLAELRELLDVQSPLWTYAHRWRFAKPVEARDELCWYGDGIALAGDGWGTSKVETAWRSGVAAAEAVLGR